MEHDFDEYDVYYKNGDGPVRVIWSCLKHNLLPIGVVDSYIKVYCAID